MILVLIPYNFIEIKIINWNKIKFNNVIGDIKTEDETICFYTAYIFKFLRLCC